VLRLVIKQAHENGGRGGRGRGVEDFLHRVVPWDFFAFTLFYFHYFYHRRVINLGLLRNRNRNFLRDRPFSAPPTSGFSKGISVSARGYEYDNLHSRVSFYGTDMHG